MLRFKEGKSTLEILSAFDIKGRVSPSSSCLGASVKCSIELKSCKCWSLRLESSCFDTLGRTTHVYLSVFLRVSDISLYVHVSLTNCLARNHCSLPFHESKQAIKHPSAFSSTQISHKFDSCRRSATSRPRHAEIEPASVEDGSWTGTHTDLHSSTSPMGVHQRKSKIVPFLLVQTGIQLSYSLARVLI